MINDDYIRRLAESGKTFPQARPQYLVFAQPSSLVHQRPGFANADIESNDGAPDVDAVIVIFGL